MTHSGHIRRICREMVFLTQVGVNPVVAYRQGREAGSLPRASGVNLFLWMRFVVCLKVFPTYVGVNLSWVRVMEAFICVFHAPAGVIPMAG